MHAGTNVHLLVQGSPKPSLPLGFAPSTPDISDGEGAMLSDSQVEILFPQNHLNYGYRAIIQDPKMDMDALLLCMQELYCHAWRCMEYRPMDLMHESLPLHCMHDWQACNAWEWRKHAWVETWQKLTAVLVWCHRETQMRRFLATTASFPLLQEPSRDSMRSSSQSRPPLVRPAEYY